MGQRGRKGCTLSLPSLVATPPPLTLAHVPWFTRRHVLVPLPKSPSSLSLLTIATH